MVVGEEEEEVVEGHVVAAEEAQGGAVAPAEEEVAMTGTHQSPISLNLSHRVRRKAWLLTFPQDI